MNQQDEFQKGFESAVRNIVASIDKQHKQENNLDIKLGLQIALDTAKSYHGFMDTNGGQE
jgi:hypothetical protein